MNADRSPQPTAVTTHPVELIDERAAAALLGCAVNTLRNWRALRQGPRYLKIGQRMVRYARADLATFIAAAPSEGTAA